MSFDKPDITHNPPDILLLCALKDEFDQVLNVTDGLSSLGWQSVSDSSGRLFADGQFMAKNNKNIHIRATYAGYMGREQAQAVASNILRETPVRCIAMSGICAGRRGKLELGDVIVAERLWSYDAGKSTIENGKEFFQGDMLQYRLPEVWVQHMQNISAPASSPWLTERPELPLEHQENWVLLQLSAGKNPTEQDNFDVSCPNWSEVIQRLWTRDWIRKSTIELTEEGKKYIERLKLLNPKGLPKPATFSIHVAPLATGATVKEDENIFSRLSQSMRKVLGLDMEASGVAALAETFQIPAIIAKGVSDFGDKFKDDRYRTFAARASAEVLIAFLRDTYHLLPKLKNPISSLSQHVTSIESSKNFLDTLAEVYPDVSDVRALWERAGGMSRDIENVPRPRDLWQGVWKKSLQGAKVTPTALLTILLEENPYNSAFIEKMAELSYSNNGDK